MTPAPGVTPVPTPAVAYSSIPYTAWEQAVFVAMFIVFVGIVFALTRWQMAQMNKMVGEFRAFMTIRDASWQGFMNRSMDQYDKMSKLVSDQFDARSEAMTESLRQNTQAITSLQTFIITSLSQMAQHRSIFDVLARLGERERHKTYPERA